MGARSQSIEGRSQRYTPPPPTAAANAATTSRSTPSVVQPQEAAASRDTKKRNKFMSDSLHVWNNFSPVVQRGLGDVDSFRSAVSQISVQEAAAWRGVYFQVRTPRSSPVPRRACLGATVSCDSRLAGCASLASLVWLAAVADAV